MKIGIKALLLAALAITGVAGSYAQTGGLGRSGGTIYGTKDSTGGTYIEVTCGGTIAANDVVYWDTAAKVQKAPTSGNTQNLAGVANRACAATATATVPSTTFVQISGVANVVADGTVAIGDLLGAPTGTAGRAKSLATLNNARILGKALTATTSGAGDTVRVALSLNRSALPGEGTVVDATGDSTLTSVQCGATVLLDKNSGITITLPAPANITGCYFDFVNNIAYSSGSITVVTDAATTFILGTTNVVVENSATSKGFTCNGSSHVKIIENGTTTGGIAGGHFRLRLINGTQWQVQESAILGSGAIATPCST